MPTIEIEGFGAVEADHGTRLVNAIRASEADIGHRCGGQAKCTTCRVRFSEGEPEKMTRAEYEKLDQTDALGDYRLSCQITVDRPMTVTPLMLAEEMGWDDPGPAPAAEVEPEAQWRDRADLEAETEAA
jgi:ferredoxin